jgi:tight adherence protein C
MNLVVFLIVGLLLAFVAVFVFATQFFKDQKELEIRRKTGMDEARVWSDDIVLVKWFYPFILMLLPLVKLLPLDSYKQRIRKLIVNINLDGVLGEDELIALQIILALFFPPLANVLFQGIIAAIFACIFGLFFPLIWLWEKRKNRQASIVQSLPNIVDMLALSVEAGSDFNSAIVRVCEQQRDKPIPLVQEFILMNQNMRLGLNREDALKTMASRIDLRDVYSFTSILIQAEKMGASIGKTLKGQADKLRRERFMNAEKLGAEASQKLLIPMVIFVFPLIFFVVLGPYILKFIYNN